MYSALSFTLEKYLLKSVNRLSSDRTNRAIHDSISRITRDSQVQILNHYTIDITSLYNDSR